MQHKNYKPISKYFHSTDGEIVSSNPKSVDVENKEVKVTFDRNSTRNPSGSKS
jgi:hypothetical protein